MTTPTPQPRNLKVFSGTITAAAADRSRHAHSGHVATQVKVTVCTTSKKAAYDLLGISSYDGLRRLHSRPTRDDTIFEKHPGTVFISPVSPSQIVAEDTGYRSWVERPDQEGVAQRYRDTRTSVAETEALNRARSEQDSNERAATVADCWDQISKWGPALVALGINADSLTVDNGRITMTAATFADTIRCLAELANKIDTLESEIDEATA